MTYIKIDANTIEKEVVKKTQTTKTQLLSWKDRLNKDIEYVDSLLKLLEKEKTL